MTVYFSATAAARHDLDHRARYADGLSHGGLTAVNAELARPAPADPPAYTATAGVLGWAARVEAERSWFEAGQAGDPADYEHEGDDRG